MKTVLELRKTNQALPELDFLLLLSFVISKPKEWLMAHPEYRLSNIQYARFWWLARQRKRGVPLAYITSHKEFYGLDFYVDKRVLVPRPETETLVEAVLAETDLDDAVLVDIGTGSGCIPIAILKNLKTQNVKAIATDISNSALMVAKQNARTHNLLIQFLQGHLLEAFDKNKKLLTDASKIIITANLPYGWKEWKNQSSAQTVGLKFEPAQALFTGENGLQLYRELFEQIRTVFSLVPNSLKIFIEFDPRQTELLKKLVTAVFANAQMEIKKDLAGRDRVAKITL